QVEGLTKEQIDALVRLPLPAGYGSLSVKALGELLKHMRDGLVYQAKDESDSARHRAGFPRRDEVTHRIHEELPHLTQLTDPRNELHDPQFPHISNPVVLRA